MKRIIRLVPGAKKRRMSEAGYDMPPPEKANPRFTPNDGTIIKNDHQAELENAVLRAVTIKTRKNRRRVQIAIRRAHGV